MVEAVEPEASTGQTEVLDSNSPGNTESVAAPAVVDSFVVHVASFQDKERALHFRIRLEKNGYGAYVQASPEAYGRTWHRVYLGPFAGHDTAALVVDELKEEGIINYSQIARH